MSGLDTMYAKLYKIFSGCDKYINSYFVIKQTNIYIYKYIKGYFRILE